MAERAIGAGQVDGMIRIGGKELGQALPAFPSQSIQPVNEPGTVGNPTPSQIDEQQKPFSEVVKDYTPGYSADSDRDMER